MNRSIVQHFANIRLLYTLHQVLSSTALNKVDYSYLVEPVADPRSLFSLAHGAGRKWMRSECKERLSARYRVEQLARTALGSRVICGDRGLIYEEAPEAYKAIDSVVGALREAGLLRVLARLKPVLTYKTRGECC